MKALDRVLNSGEVISIKYSERLGILPRRAKTSYLVEEVKILSPSIR